MTLTDRQRDLDEAVKHGFAEAWKIGGPSFARRAMKLTADGADLFDRERDAICAAFSRIQSERRFAALQRKAASGTAGCVKARKEMQREREAQLRGVVG